MTPIETFFAIVVGLMLRILIPLLLTVLIVFVLSRLDARWKAEAQELMAAQAANPVQIPCWETKECDKDRKAKCPAYASPNIPCWQTFRSADGHLREGCLECDVFQDAPVPVASPVKM